MSRRPIPSVTLALLAFAASNGSLAQIQPAADQASDLGPAQPAPPAPPQGDEELATIPVATDAPPPPPPEDRASGNRLIEEVVVTAQKREQNLQDVPISVQAFSADSLDARGITSTAELPRITPSLTVTSSFGYAMTYLRGIGSDAFLFADPSVVQYVDGVYNPFGVGLVSDFGEVERIEVLKGPQGTLFGRNAIGGAISIVTKKAPLDHYTVSAQATYKDFDYWQTRASVGVPLIDGTLGISLGGIFNEGRPYTDGTVHGQAEDNNRTKGGRIKLRWAPAEWTELNLMAYKLDESSQSAQFGPNDHPSPILGAAIRPQDPYKGSLDTPIAFSINSTTYSGDLQFFTDWLDIKLLGSDQHIENRQVLDFDGSPLPLVSFQADPGQADVRTAELQLISNDTSWGSDWLQYIFGVYYFWSDSGLKRATFNATNTDIENGTILGLDLPPAIVNVIK
jgi:iron complex outermembrane receptor protein